MDKGWTTPINISQSGAATNPRAVIDAEGIIHLFWFDSIDGFVYIEGNGVNWEDPRPIETPFGTRSYFDLEPEEPTPYFLPEMLIDSEDNIHAFWHDGEGNLFSSSVTSDSVDIFSEWSRRQFIADGTVKVAIAKGNNDRLHLARAQSAQTDNENAGIYYQFSDDNGENWSEPVLLYTSSYFRLLQSGEARLQIAISPPTSPIDSNNGQTREAEPDQISIAWDDSAKERVYVIRSTDMGESWGELKEIDRREQTDAEDAVGPSNIHMAMADKELHLVWQAGHEGANCSVFHKQTTKEGALWEKSKQLIVAAITECPERIQLFTIDDSSLFLLLSYLNDTYLLYYKDGKWQEPQVQENLSNLVNTDTFRPIQFGCEQLLLKRASKVYLLNCSSENGQDIWISSHNADGLKAPLPPQIWQNPSTIKQSDSLFLSPQLVADPEGFVHGFWREGGTSTTINENGVRVYYSRWNERSWSRPVSISPPARGDVEYFAAMLDQENLLLVWSGGINGQLFFNQVTIDQAILAAEWPEPQQLPTSRLVIGDLDIDTDSHGNIFIVYAAPLNEGRGIYLTISGDEGDNWSDPILVFDGVAANWRMVDSPRLSISENGVLHLLVIQQPSLFGGNGASLHYLRSTDQGLNWSKLSQVKTGSTAPSAAIWHDILTTRQGSVHRVWQEWNGRQLNLYHQLSQNEGEMWSPAILVSNSDTQTAPVTLSADRSGQLQMLQVVDGLEAKHMVWDGDSWRREDNYVLSDSGDGTTIGEIAGIISDDNKLLAAFSTSGSSEQFANGLLSTQRVIELGDDLSIPESQIVPTSTPQPAPTSEPIPLPTPTIAFPIDRADSGSNSMFSFLSGLSALEISLSLAAVTALAFISLGVYLQLRVRREN